jgi:hypothetical protein
LHQTEVLFTDAAWIGRSKIHCHSSLQW